jgi:hypothetical protein
MIPNSPKLANFFTSARPRSSQKSLSTTSTDDPATRRPDAPKKI